MSTRERSRTTAHRALWFAGLLILLAGIIGMHGLNSHAGGMAADAHAVALHDPTAPGSGTPPSLHHEMAAVVQDLTGPALTVADSVVAGATGMGAGMTGMCMAVLALALAMLLRFLGAAPAVPPYRLAGAPARAPRPHGRDPDPPSLSTLSIRRC